MNFFAAVKQVLFASKLFASIAFNFEDAYKAGDEAALKAHLDKAVSAKAGDTAEQEKLIADAVAENTRLSAELAGTTLAQGIGDAALKAVGIDLAACTDNGALSADKLNAAFKLTVAKAARVELAKHGVTQVDETVVTDATKQKGAVDKLTTADFYALSMTDRLAFIRKGGKIE